MEVVEEKFYSIVNFIKDATNYAGGGQEPHNVDCDENYYIMRNNVKTLIAEAFYDMGVERIYRVDDEVYKRYLEICGYTL